MTKPKFLTPKFMESAVRFVVYVLAIMLTPFLAKPTAHIWDWVAYGGLYTLFVEIHTVFFWLAEAFLFHFVGTLLAKKGWLPSAKEKQALKEAEAREGERDLYDFTEGADESAIGDHVYAEKKGKPRPMPRKNLWILTGIVAACVLLVSAVIGFKVKPFYDLGEKITGYDIWNAVGGIGRNAFKCMWVMGMLINGLRMADEIVEGYGLSKKPWLRYLIGGSILMIFGLLDVFTSILLFPTNWRGVLLGITYVLFYAVFPIVYYYAEEHNGKAYLITAFIYLF